MRSTIHVYQVGEADRVYEAMTDDGNDFYGVEAQQLSGPSLPITVAELRYKFWGGGGNPPEHPTRVHFILHTPEGAKYPAAMNEIRGGEAAIEIFKEYGQRGELGYWIPETAIVTEGA
jgi:hypothetical protein